MPRRAGITAAGRARVERALERTGVLLVQGQWEIDSVADLLAGVPVRTLGYSWDYEPAWRLTDEYESGTEVAVVKLFRGRRTLVHRRLWSAVDALATAAHACVQARPARDSERRFLLAVDENPGAPLSDLREQLGLERRAGDRARRNLEQWLCVFGRERTDVEYHTHEPSLFPWRDTPIARAGWRRKALDPESALTLLAGAAGTKPGVFPVARLLRG